LVSDISASGTASSTTYLRGDGSWQTISGGGSIYDASNGIKLDSSTFKHDTSTLATQSSSEGGITRVLTPGSTFNIPTINYDAYGHIRSKGAVTLTLPNDASCAFGSDNQIPFMNNTNNNFSYSNNLTWNDSSLYIGGNAHIKSNLVVDGSLDINGTNVTIDGSAYIGSTMITNYQYMGNPTTDGSWRFFVSQDASADLVFQKRIAGIWIEGGRFGF
jgi:hypothetical protein